MSLPRIGASPTPSPRPQGEITPRSTNSHSSIESYFPPPQDTGGFAGTTADETDEGAPPMGPPHPFRQEAQVRSLHRATNEGNSTNVQAALQGGVDPNAVNTSTGKTALMSAAENGHTDICAMLIADPRTLINTTLKDKEGPTQGQTALHLAAQNGHTAIIKLLVQSGATPKSMLDAYAKYATPGTALGRQTHDALKESVLARANRVQATLQPDIGIALDPHLIPDLAKIVQSYTGISSYREALVFLSENKALDTARRP